MGGTKTSVGRKPAKTTKAPASPVSQTVQLLIESAVKAGASDVHIEPRPGYGVVRQRVDGLLQITTKLPGASFAAVIAHLKSLAKLNENQQLKPQAGHFTTTIGRRSYVIDIATLPVLDGERVTLHLTDTTLKPLTLKELGFWGQTLRHINHAITQPRGLIIVSGCDEISSQLTLSSMLNTLLSPHLNVATVEEKLFYNLPRVNQTTVKREIGMTFGRRLKQVLAYDPNVVMVSDVFDTSTAKTLVSAATNRQLILAGVHAQNTVSALAGLLQLADEPTLLSASFQVTVSVQLVPRLCPACREAYSPDAALTKKLATIFGIDNEVRMRKLFKLELEAIDEGLGADSQPSTTVRHITRLWRAHEDGCKVCGHTGYAGHITIHEAIPQSAAVQTALHSAASATELRKVARVNGMVPLAQDALVKALRGLVPIETVLAHTSNH